jgi:hypothetical protein
VYRTPATASFYNIDWWVQDKQAVSAARRMAGLKSWQFIFSSVYFAHLESGRVWLLVMGGLGMGDNVYRGINQEGRLGDKR